MRHQLSPYRRGLIASVKIAQKDMALDDTTYRAMLNSVCGKSSATECSDKELTAVLAEMRAKGWTPKPRAPKAKSTPQNPLQPLHKKIAAQLQALDKPAAYGEGILQRMYGKAATMQGATRQQLTALVAALTRQQARS